MSGAVAATGHRFVTLPGTSVARRIEGHLEVALKDLVAAKIAEIEPDSMIVGGALGFDMLVGEVCVSLGVPFTIAIPFKGHDAKWPEAERQRLVDLSVGASRIHYVSRPGYADHKLKKRNHWMIDNAKCVLALWDGRQRTGTGEAVLYAWSRRKGVENLWRDFLRHTNEF